MKNTINSFFFFLRWSCPTQNSVFWESDVLSNQTIFTANNREQEPLRQLFHLYWMDSSDIWMERGDEFMIDYSSFQQKKPPKNTFQVLFNF